MKKIIAYIITMIILICPIIVNAETVLVTKESLTKALEDLKTWSNDSTLNDDMLSKIKSYSVSDNEIEIELENEKNKLSYSIGDDNKITFQLRHTFTNNMQYDEYAKKEESYVNIMYGYILIAYIQGATINDAVDYYNINYVEFLLSMLDEIDVPFAIRIEDDNDNEEAEVIDEKITINGKEIPIITEEEFPPRSLEYANACFTNKYTHKDNRENYLDSFVLEARYENKNDSSIDYLYELIVDSSRDYTKLKEINEKIENDFSNEFDDNISDSQISTNETTQEQTTQEQTTQEQISQNQNDNNNNGEFENPQTGAIIPGIIVIIGFGTILTIKLITKKNKLYNL